MRQLFERKSDGYSLHLRGQCKSYGGAALPQLFVASLWTNRTVSAFDLRGNAAGYKLLHGLASLLAENRVVEAVHIEDNQITKLSHYSTFFQTLIDAGRQVNVAWPEKEIEMMVQYGTATQEEKANLRSLWERVQRSRDPVAKSRKITHTS
jgi:hypothetical protein